VLTRLGTVMSLVARMREDDVVSDTARSLASLASGSLQGHVPPAGQSVAPGGVSEVMYTRMSVGVHVCSVLSLTFP